MSVKIRLSKTGKKHQISFRIVAMDTKTKRDGAYLDLLGFFNPSLKAPLNLKINKEKYDSWVKKGAKPTIGVSKLLNGAPAINK